MNGSNSTSLYFKESLNYGWFNLPPPPTPPSWFGGTVNMYMHWIYIRGTEGGGRYRGTELALLLGGGASF